MVSTEHILSFFDEPLGVTPSEAYKQYVEEGLATERTEFGAYLERSAIAFGSPDFQKKIGEMFVPSIDPLMNGSSKARAMLSKLAYSADEVCKHVDMVLPHRPFRKRRQIKQYLLQKLTFHSNRTIASHLTIHATTVAKASIKLQGEMELDVELREEVQATIESLCYHSRVFDNKKL
jgi:hypothetical protein